MSVMSGAGLGGSISVEVASRYMIAMIYWKKNLRIEYIYLKYIKVYIWIKGRINKIKCANSFCDCVVSVMMDRTFKIMLRIMWSRTRVK